jgi:hypothetical protein
VLVWERLRCAKQEQEQRSSDWELVFQHSSDPNGKLGPYKIQLQDIGCMLRLRAITQQADAMVEVVALPIEGLGPVEARMPKV